MGSGLKYGDHYTLGDAASAPHAFSRIEALLGKPALARFASAHVVVLGYGAVGSFAAEALCRSGVGALRIIDADNVEITNTNRQLCAYQSTLGQRKVDIAKMRLADINPHARIEVVHRFIDATNVASVFDFFENGEKPCLVLDAIDSVASKVDIIAYAHSMGIPVISSMGAARKTRPEAIRVADIADTTHCPLAKTMRKKLKQRGIQAGVRCVYSMEDATPMVHAKQTLASMITVTGCFGLQLASEALRILQNGDSRIL